MNYKQGFACFFCCSCFVVGLSFTLRLDSEGRLGVEERRHSGRSRACFVIRLPCYPSFLFFIVSFNPQRLLLGRRVLPFSSHFTAPPLFFRPLVVGSNITISVTYIHIPVDMFSAPTRLLLCSPCVRQR